MPKLANKTVAATNTPIARRTREILRQHFRPTKLKILFVGEAPPASGKFFYRQDSGLYRAIRDVFHHVDASVTDDNFLRIFQSAGCYLTDLCPQPVDQLEAKPRRAVCLESASLLARRIRKLQPEIIVCLVRSIRSNVDRAAAKAGWSGTIVGVPYPGRWIRHREVFRDAIIQLLESVLVKRRGPL